MSFGVGLSDVVLVSSLAWKIYQCCKSAPSDFKTLAAYVWSVYTLLHEIEHSFEELHLNKYQHKNLQKLVAQCADVLNELETVLQRYECLVTGPRRWRVMKWQMESDGLNQMKQRLMDQIALLTSFNTSIMM
jgi:hypothetical protein